MSRASDLPPQFCWDLLSAPYAIDLTHCFDFCIDAARLLACKLLLLWNRLSASYCWRESKQCLWVSERKCQTLRHYYFADIKLQIWACHSCESPNREFVLRFITFIWISLPSTVDLRPHYLCWLCHDNLCLGGLKGQSILTAHTGPCWRFCIVHLALSVQKTEAQAAFGSSIP